MAIPDLVRIDARGIDDVQRRLRTLSTRSFPQALKGVVNAMAKEIWALERKTISDVFDNPTPFIRNSLSIQKWATVTSPEARVAPYRNIKKTIDYTLEPHIHGFSNLRHEKRSETWLRRRRFIRNDEFLMPSRTMPRDAFGNVRGSTMQKMLADVGAFTGAEGFESTTRDARAKYIFGTVGGRRGRQVKGIWRVEGGRRNMERGRWHLMMIVVKKPPLYQKRFDFFGIAKSYAAQNWRRVADEYVARALNQR